jgi:uncharacterized protein (TIGR02145 family)
MSIKIKAQELNIGSQIWSSKNLNVSIYRNGDTIPQIKDGNSWANLSVGAWCYFENKIANDTTYGKLYNWFAINDPRGLAPIGYHVPTIAEWRTLSDYLGGDSIAGQKMKSNYGWKNNGNGTNSIGFAGLAGGLRYSFGNFSGIGAYGYWWSSSEGNISSGWHRFLNYNCDILKSNTYYKQSGFSVRCLRD